jgi:hypothetical protein
MFAQGPARAASHRLIFENSPENWQAGFPIGNGDFGGLVFQPPESLVEIAFTRLDNWHHNLTPWQRLTLDELRKISAENPEVLPGLLAKERRCGDEPIFKPGGRLRVWQEEFGGTVTFRELCRLAEYLHEIQSSVYAALPAGQKLRMRYFMNVI